MSYQIGMNCSEYTDSEIAECLAVASLDVRASSPGYEAAVESSSGVDFLDLE